MRDSTADVAHRTNLRTTDGNDTVTWAQAALRRIAAALTYRDFRVLWFGAFTSTIGTWMQKVAQSWLVLDLTGSNFYLGLDDFLSQLPILLFMLIGGVVADRYDRRRRLHHWRSIGDGGRSPYHRPRVTDARPRG